MKTAPLLSIGMIFKNEERCIERCLQSLEPLRKAIPCELVMADTGATDGSRAIVERYADVVFDFAWINDFAAARNAVMDRCRGKWYLSIDCDEWLDENITELTAFLKGCRCENHGFVTVRNYRSPELEKSASYTDFSALRLLRMSTGQRYEGTIHESWDYSMPVALLAETLLHHDGYVYTDKQTRKEKLKRNMKLLRGELARHPQSLRVLSQCIESGDGDPELLQYIRQAIQIVCERRDDWEEYGPRVLRHAVETAQRLELPELTEWVEIAETMFPDSGFVRVDIQNSAFLAAYDAKKWDDAIRRGEAYRKGLLTMRADHSIRAVREKIQGGVLAENPDTERTLLTGLADAYAQNGQGEKALETLSALNGGELTPKQTRNVVAALVHTHARSMLDTGPFATGFYKQTNIEIPDKDSRNARLTAFTSVSSISFTAAYRRNEQQEDGYRRPAYTAFAALADVCEAGRGARLMMAIDPGEMREILARVEDWQAFPIEALEYALREGVEFPLPEKPLPIEVLDGLAARLTREDNLARQLALALPEDAKFDSLQSLYWAQALVLAALHSFDWSLGKNSAPVSKFACPEKKKDEEQDERPKDTPEVGLALIRRFAQLESALLPLLYAPSMLTEQNAALLPPMHRWGLTCTRAFAALDAGNPQEYLATLRKGLAACPGQKDMVQFLLDRFVEDARPKANPELLALAEKVRAILAAYGPDHPAAKAIRESDAYKQVAWIIEETPGIPVQ